MSSTSWKLPASHMPKVRSREPIQAMTSFASDETQVCVFIGGHKYSLSGDAQSLARATQTPPDQKE